MRSRLASLLRRGKSLVCRRAAVPCDRALCPRGIFALAGLPCGACCVVRSIELAHEKADALRRVGIREGSQVSLLGAGDPVVVMVDNTRIALSRRLAGSVRVEAASR
jgi:Fe2+ transport system protein FeoA